MSFTSALDKLKESFLVAAAQGGSSQDCESLLEMGANINWKGGEGDTPLLAAVRRGHRDTMQLLIAHGADINIPGANDNSTPLHICARRGDIEGINLLLECSNVNLNLKDKDGLTALELAKVKGNEAIQNRLSQWKKETVDIRVNSAAERPLTSSSSMDSPRSFLDADAKSVSGANFGSSLLPPTSSSGSRGSSSGSASISNSSTAAAVNNSRKKSEDKTGGADASYTLISSNVNPNAQAGPLREPRDSRRLSNSGSSSNISGTAAPGKTIVGTDSSSSSKTTDSSDELSNRTLADSKSSYDANNPTNLNSREIALKKIIEQEQRLRKSLETKIEALSEQNLHMNLELSSANHISADLRSRFDELESRYNRLSGKESVMNHLTLDDCNDLERELKASLAAVEVRKDYIIKNELGKGQEQRLCVVCCEREKSVVLLPCRHMCLCDECAQNDQISTCPLCRKVIGHRISVFA